MATKTNGDIHAVRGDLPKARVKGKRAVRTFYSVRQFLDCALEAKNRGLVLHDNDGASRDGFAECTMDECVKSAREGWAKARPMVNKVMAHVSKMVDADLLRTDFVNQFDCIGGTCDVGRFMENDAECMFDPVPQKVAVRGRVVRIIVPTSYHCGVDGKLAIRRGVAIAALIEAMQAAHYTLEVWAMSAQKSFSSSQEVIYATRVKGPNEGYDPAIVAFGTGHPGMLRRLTFLVNNQEPKWLMDEFSGSYGCPVEVSAADLPDECEGPSILLPMLHGNDAPWSGSDEDIAEWIEGQVRSIRGDEV